MSTLFLTEKLVPVPFVLKKNASYQKYENLQMVARDWTREFYTIHQERNLCALSSIIFMGLGLRKAQTECRAKVYFNS